MGSNKTETVKASKLLKRALSYMLTTVMVFSGFNMIPGAVIRSSAATLEAAETLASQTQETGISLVEGKAYAVTDDVTIKATGNGKSALVVPDQGTVIIYIAKGKTLTVEGGPGSGTTGGGAGIYVPSNATLIVTGAGTLIAKGGKGGSAGNGSSGGSASVLHGGDGGKGGNGSGGAGAGIGTPGASGGAEVGGGAGSTSNNGSGNSGGSNNGANAAKPGNIYFIGTVTINAYGGAAATAATATSFSNGSNSVQNNGLIDDATAAWGGKAGESGSATYQAAGIGAGAPGGKSGRSGGGGGTSKTYSEDDARINASNRCGSNGGSVSNGSVSAACTYNKVSTATISNNSGSTYTSPTAGYGTKATEVELDTTSATYKGLLSQTTISFYNDIDDINPSRQINAMYGVAVSKDSRTVTTPKKSNYTFTGYFTGKTDGDMIYDGNGILVKGNDYVTEDYIWIKPTDTILYAHWELDGEFGVTFSDTVEKDFYAESDTYENIPEINISYMQDLTDVCVFNTDTQTSESLVPTRIGYEFAGFADSITGGTLVFDAEGKLAAENVKSDVKGQIIKSNKWVNPGSVTLYAQWTPIKYNFTFDVNTGDGNNVTKNNVDIANGYPTPITIAKQKKPGQLLKGYAAKADGEELIYKVSDDDTTVFEFDPATVTARPNGTDITLYAVWGDADYEVAYYDRDWATLEQGAATVDKIDTKKINDNLYKFTYGEFMLKSLAELDYNPGDEVAKNYSFLGWSTDPYAKKADYEAGKQYQGGLTTTSGEIVNLYAVWVKTNGADISYNGNGSLDAPATHVPADDEVIFDKVDNDEKKYATYKIEPKYQPVRAGYTFLGWSKSATDSENLYVPGINGVEVDIYEDTVFYAQWKINPLISYDANGGSFVTEIYDEDGKTIDLFKAQRYQAITSVNIPVVDPRSVTTYELDAEGKVKTDEQSQPISKKIDAISRPGYTFVGWTVTGKDSSFTDDTVYSSGNVDKGEPVINPTLASMPDTDLVFKAKWVKKQYTQNLIADKDVYTISYTGTYNKDGVITKLEGNEENAKIDVPLTAGTGDLSTKFVGSLQDIPYESNIILSVTVDGKYNAENVVVKINDTVYKPATTTVAAVAETVAEDKQGATTYTYRIDDITSTEFKVDISGAIAKNYKVQYKPLNSEATVPDNAIKEYNAGDTKNLVAAADTSKYTFSGWYKTEEGAKNLTAADKIAQIPSNARGNKTYYAGWSGKTYKVTFNKLYGTTGGKTDDAPTQTLTFGQETALTTLSELFDDNTDGGKGKLVGPNGATFLGWAKSEKDAFDHKVAYTDGQNVKDITEKVDDAQTTNVNEADIVLWAVWDIEKVTISFNANGGKFPSSNVVDTRDIIYGETAADAVQEMSALEAQPIKEGYQFNGWSKKAGSDVEVSTTDKLYTDDTYYAIWTADEHSFKYYKTAEGGGDYEEKDAHNGDIIVIGLNNLGDEVTPIIPAEKRLVGWTTTQNGKNVMYAQGEQIIVSATSGTNLYPVFEDKETHILAYSANGGKFTSTPKAAEMTYDNETNEYYLKTITVEPTREGYVFGGWSVKSANPAENEIIAKGERYAYTVPNTDVEYNHILYAVWTPIKYTITYNANKAPAVDTSMINKADADASKPILKETLPEGIEKVTDSSYKQTFEYDKEGNFVAPQFDYPGYVFKGWAESATGNVVYKNLQDVINMTTVDGKNYTVYAVWEMDTPLTITYRANGGALKQITPAATVENPNPVPEDVEDITDQKYVRIADKLTGTVAENVYVRDGYTFLGWSTDPKTYAADEEIPVTAIILEAGKEYQAALESAKTTITLYAVWKKLPTYKVVYNLNNGAGSVPIDLTAYHIDTDVYLDDKIEEHNVVTLDPSVVPTRTGYTFLGWADKADAKEANYVFTDKVEADPVNNIEAQDAKLTPATFTIEAAETDKAENTINLYAVWQANTYKINYFKVDKKDSTKTIQIGEQEFAYDDEDEITGKLMAVADLSFTPKVEEGQESVTNTYKATPGYVFAGWSFKPLGTLSLEDKAPIKNVLTGATKETKEFNLYAVETEKILNVTLNDDFETIGAKFLADADQFETVEDKSFYNFYDSTWGKASVNIKNRAADDKVYTKEETDTTATVLEKTGVDNDNHKYLVKYTKALNDITVPKAPGFVFKGYYNGDVKYYDASGNAVKDADFTEDITLKAKWEPIEFSIIFKENGEKIDEMNQTFGDSFKMPNTVRHLSYNSDKEVVGWTTSVDNQNPDTALIDGMQAYDSPDKFLLNTEYSAIIIARLYNNYNADITMYPIYKTTRKYKVYFSSEDQTKVTNLPETQEVAWKDTFVVKFDDTVMRTPQREGYTFLGWSDKNGEEAKYAYEKGKSYDIENVEDNFTLYAVWSPNTYNIAYYNGTEKVIEEEVVYPYYKTADSTDPYTLLPADAKDNDEKPLFVGADGYNLIGWSLDSNASKADLTPGQKLGEAFITNIAGKDTVNVYAVWAAGDYEIEFVNPIDPSDDSMVNQVMTIGKSSPLNKCLFKADGYKYSGWALTADATQPVYSDGQYVDLTSKVGKNTSIKLYAVATPDIKGKTVTETFIPEGYDVTKLFDNLDKAGTATFSIKDKPEGAAISDANVLTVSKAGTYVIVVDTAAKAGITAATAEATITVERTEVVTEGKVEFYKDNVKITDVPAEYAYTESDKVDPRLNITTGPEDAVVTYEYKVKTESDDTYKVFNETSRPTEAGTYLIRATVGEDDIYNAFTEIGEFVIVDKIQAVGTIATYKADGENEVAANEYIKGKDEVIVKVTFTEPAKQEDYTGTPVYYYKGAGKSDDTYTTEVPTDVGDYTVRAVVPDTDDYLGFTTDPVNFTIKLSDTDEEVIAKAEAVEKAEADVLKRLQDTYDTLKNSNNYSDGQLEALGSAYAEAKAALGQAIDAIADNAEIKSTEVPAAAEEALAEAKSALLKAVKETAANEAADKAVADAEKNAAAVATASDAIINSTDDKYIQEDKDNVSAAKEALDAIERPAADATNEQKEDYAKKLQDAVDALDAAIDEANLHAAIAEAVMNQENIQPFVKKVAKDSLNEYADRIKPDNMTEEEAAAYDKALADAEKSISDAANNEAVTKALADAKAAVKEVVDGINDTRTADAAVEAAEATSTAAETAADEAVANEYASEEDKTAVANAKEALEAAKTDLKNAEDNDAKNAAAKAVQDAVEELQKAVNTANTNSAAAKAAADAKAAEIAAEEEAKAAENKKLEDAKTTAKERLEDVYDAKNIPDYRAEQQKELAAAKEAGEKAIDAAKTPAEANSALAAAKKAINAVKTDATLTKEEAAAAAKAKAEAEAKIKPYDPVDTSKLTVNNATGSAKNGSIEGVDSTMQYSLNGKTWTDIAEGSTSISGLGAGKVYLRKKADATHKASKAITVTIKSVSPTKATFYTLFLHTSKVTKKGMTLTWSKVDGAAKYAIYGGRYGSTSKKLGETTSTKNVRNSLSPGKIYRYYVVALDAKGNTLCTSATVYTATKGGKFTNYKSVKTSAAGNAVKVSVGGTFNLNAKTVKPNSKLKIKKIQGLKYESTNPGVAKVTKKGVITGVKKGTCYVYVYAQNGVYKKIKVTVE